MERGMKGKLWWALVEVKYWIQGKGGGSTRRSFVLSVYLMKGEGVVSREIDAGAGNGEN